MPTTEYRARKLLKKSNLRVVHGSGVSGRRIYEGYSSGIYSKGGIMRKAQKKIIGKGKGLGFSKSQMNALKREDLTVKQLNDVLNMCRYIPGIPGREAVQHVKGKSYKPNDTMYFSSWALYRELSYDEYKELPKELHDNPRLLSTVNELYIHTDMQQGFPGFAEEALSTYHEECLYLLKYESANWIIDISGWTVNPRDLNEHRIFDKDFLFYLIKCQTKILRSYENNQTLCRKYRDAEIKVFQDWLNRIDTEEVNNRREETRNYCMESIKELEKNGLNSRFRGRVPYMLMEDFGKIRYIEQCFRDNLNPERVAESYFNKERLYEEDDPDDRRWSYVRETKEYEDLCRVFPEEMKDKAVFFIDLAAWFPYRNKEVVTLGFDLVMVSDLMKDTDLKDFHADTIDRTCYSIENDGIINHSYANNGYLTLRRKNGRKVTKYGFPVFGAAEDLNKIIGLVVHFGTRKKTGSFLIPVNSSFEENNEAVSVIIHIMGAYNSGSKLDVKPSIEIEVCASEENGILPVKHYSTNPSAKNVEHLDCVRTAYDEVFTIEKIIDIPVGDKREIHNL